MQCDEKESYSNSVNFHFNFSSFLIRNVNLIKQSVDLNKILITMIIAPFFFTSSLSNDYCINHLIAAINSLLLSIVLCHSLQFSMLNFFVFSCFISNLWVEEIKKNQQKKNLFMLRHKLLFIHTLLVDCISEQNVNELSNEMKQQQT